MNIWQDVNIAITVPVNLMPLIDDTDFKTREIAITYNESGMDLVWNFQTTAGITTQTSVTPTTSGDYDWIHSGDGMYKIEIPASGGASINNDTEGFGWFTGICDGVLVWRGPVIGFRAATLNNALIDGGDILDVSIAEIGGDTQSATDLKDFADAGYDPVTNKVQGVVLVDTTTTTTDMRGTDSAALASALATHETNRATMETTLVDEHGTTQVDISNLTEPDNTSITTILSEVQNVTYGLSAIQTLIDALDTATELQAKFDEIKGDGWTDETLKALKEFVDDLETRITQVRADGMPPATMSRV